ncbi:MAG: flagellar biosynthesis protein FlhA [Candidatus Tyrphobacter sp.]
MNGRLPVYGFATLLLGIVAILIVPLPPWLLDLLLAANIFGSALVLLLSVTVENPLEFSAFAPALLVATLFRLSLDVSATRLILTQGQMPGAVGEVIPAFGEFVVRGNLVVGVIIFAILVTIQFVVIASGSQRVAEVAARFTLDAMPGKQMAVDADVHAGLLDADAARRKRDAVQREADFYGAMDGAGKFVKGDAVAALVIVALNLAGGVVVGVAYHRMAPLDAMSTYAILSIGNALVTTLPAFLISTAMGMMVTRVASEGALGADLAAQMLARPDVLRGAGGLLLGLALVPALPHLLFALLGAGALAGAQLAGRRLRERERGQRQERDAAARKAMRKPEMALGLVGVDAVAMTFGSELTRLLAAPLCDALLDRIGEVRRALASEIGLVLPGVRLRDDLDLQAQQYAICVRDRPVARGRLDLERLLAVGETEALQRLALQVEAEPVYGLPAAWIGGGDRDRLVEAGALVFDPISVLGSHLAETARANAAALFGRQELQTLLEHLRLRAPALLKEIGTDALPLGSVHRAMLLLFREQAWPRDPIAVLEAMVDAATRDPAELAESARRAIVPDLLARRAREIEPLMLDPALERALVGSWSSAQTLDPQLTMRVCERIEAYAQRIPKDRAAVVCTAPLRAPLADLLARSGTDIEVFAYAELPSELRLKPADIVYLPS